MADPVDTRYVPAAGRDWLTSAYDPVMAATMRETAWRDAVVARVANGPSTQRIADVGCGTGTLLAALARSSEELQLTGVDGDAEALGIARGKLDKGGAAVNLTKGLADALPLDDDSCDVVTMTLLLHHLDTRTKRSAFREAARVLRPGGKLIVVDWGRPQGALFKALFLLVRTLDGFHTTRENALGLIPQIASENGFEDPAVFGRWRTAWGVLEAFEAQVSDELREAAPAFNSRGR